jgi:hypothetical protein
MESFTPDIWQAWINKQYEWMINREPYPWEDFIVEKTIKCFHLDDMTWVIPSKCGEVHDPSTQKYWGHVVTNKATRTDENFAFLFDPYGMRINQITHATFKRLAPLMVHEYIKIIPDRAVNLFIDNIPYLSKFQAQHIVKQLVKNSPHLTNYRSEYTKFKEPRFIIIDLED